MQKKNKVRKQHKEKEGGKFNNQTAFTYVQGELASVSAVAIGQAEKFLSALITRGICGQVASATYRQMCELDFNS